MIISELCNYYDFLSESKTKKDIIPKRFFSSSEVEFGINIDKEGKILSFIDLRLEKTITKGKTSKTILVPRNEIVPEHFTRSSGICPYFLSDVFKYFFGFDEKENCKAHFEAAYEYHKKIIGETENEALNAVLNYFKNFNHTKETIKDIFLYSDSILKSTKSFVFKYNGEFLHEMPEAKDLWIKFYGNSGEPAGICSVSGKEDKIARVHPKIKGVQGAQQAGANIVSFNEDAFESYGKKGGSNSSIGMEAAFKYGAALNYLLQKDSKQKIHLSDTTIVFWALSEKECYMKLFAAMLDKEVYEDETFEANIKDIFHHLNTGKPLKDIYGDLDENIKFCILGLSPNNARLSTKFFYRNKFGYFVRNLAKHFGDISIKGINRDNMPTAYELIKSCLSDTVKDIPNIWAASLINSIANNRPYPANIFSHAVKRCRFQDKFLGNEQIRMGFIKGYLIRKGYTEVKMSLDETNKDTSYNLGRLFAALEKLQEQYHKADNPSGSVNASIRDKYFAGASATPALVFPVLLKLANAHFSKLEEKGKWLDILISKIMGNLSPEFPKSQNLDEQGKFCIGYYHQKQDFYTKKEDK